jgi:hypothetical protein
MAAWVFPPPPPRPPFLFRSFLRARRAAAHTGMCRRPLARRLQVARSNVEPVSGERPMGGRLRGNRLRRNRLRSRCCCERTRARVLTLADSRWRGAFASAVSIGDGAAGSPPRAASANARVFDVRRRRVSQKLVLCHEEALSGATSRLTAERSDSYPCARVDSMQTLQPLLRP